MPGGSARFGGALNPGNLRTLMMSPQGGVRSPQEFGAAILGAFGGAPPMQQDPRIMAQSGYGPPTGNYQDAMGSLNAYQSAGQSGYAPFTGDPRSAAGDLGAYMQSLNPMPRRPRGFYRGGY